MTDLGCPLLFVEDVMSSLSENIKTLINIKDRNTGQLVMEYLAFFAGLGNAYISKWRWWKGIHFFNKEDIAEVYFEGYVDVSEEEAQRIFSEQENEIEYPKFRVDKTFEENS